jgi:hypothetical protein
MKAVVWPIVVGLFLGVAVATFVVYRFPDTHHLQTARTTTAETFQSYLLKRPSLDGDPSSH